jgi:hypothetical protein
MPFFDTTELSPTIDPANFCCHESLNLIHARLVGICISLSRSELNLSGDPLALRRVINQFDTLRTWLPSDHAVEAMDSVVVVVSTGREKKHQWFSSFAKLETAPEITQKVVSLC